LYEKGGIDDHLQVSKIHQASLSHSLSLELDSTIPKFRVVAKDKEAHGHAFGWWPSLNHHRLRPPFSG